MFGRMKKDLQRELTSLREAGLYKEERWILSPQAADIRVVYPQGSPPRDVINFCANNYLGLSSHPKVLAAAREALDTHGFGLRRVRFICGAEDCGATGRVDVITSTLGKALGGASGGFTSGRKEIIELLRQRSRPYLF